MCDIQETLKGCLSSYINIYYKVKLALCLIYLAPCHEDNWGSGGVGPPFLTSALDKGERSTFTHFPL
jgi:hypothetical protein